MTRETDVATATERLRTDGYAVIEGVVTGKRLEQLQRDAEALMEPTPIEMPGIKGPIVGRMCKQLFSKSRAFDDLYVNPMVLKVVGNVLGGNASKNRHDMWGGPLQLAGTMLKDVVPGESHRAFHYDDGLYPLPRDHATVVVNTLLAIDPFTEETGATYVVPKSHTWRRPVEQDAPFDVVEMPAGAVLFLDGSVWHNNGVNTTADRNRKALNMLYSVRWLKSANAPYLGLSEKSVTELTTPLQALL